MPKAKTKRSKKIEMPPLPPVPYREYKRVLLALNILQSQWQALLEENHQLRMKLAARPSRIADIRRSRQSARPLMGKCGPNPEIP